MAEPFVKLYSWMTALGLSASETICLAVIHSWTEYAEGFAGGMAELGRWCGLSRSHVYPVIKSLTERGLIKQRTPSRGRNASVYVSHAEPSHIGTVAGRLTVPNTDGKPSHIGTHIDNIDNIDTPYSPPTRGTANNRPTRRRKKRALNYMTRGGENYTAEWLREHGVSLGEEFYEGEEGDPNDS